MSILIIAIWALLNNTIIFENHLLSLYKKEDAVLKQIFMIKKIIITLLLLLHTSFFAQQKDSLKVLYNLKSVPEKHTLMHFCFKRKSENNGVPLWSK